MPSDPPSSKDSAERDQAERDQAERDQAERDQAERDQAERDQAERERPPANGTRSAAPGPAKRPRYLVVALIAAIVLGAGCWTEGCARLAFYRGEHDLSQTLHAGIKSDTDRARAEALFKHFTDIADAARGRAIPMAAATFVLGAALLALAARGLAGKTNARNALVQVVTAQAIVVALAYFVTRDVRNAELDWDLERRLIDQHETLPPEKYEKVVPMMRGMRPYILPTWLVIRSLASALIVLALTRPRSREFFEAAGKTVPES